MAVTIPRPAAPGSTRQAAPWSTAPSRAYHGIVSWLTTVDHKRIGICTASPRSSSSCSAGWKR